MSDRLRLDEELFFTGSWLQYLSSWMTGSPPSPPRVRRGLQIVQMDHYSQGAGLPLDIFVSVLAEEFFWLFGLRITVELSRSSLLERCDLHDEWWINTKMMESFDSAKIRSAGGAGLMAAPPCNFDAYSTFWQPGQWRNGTDAIFRTKVRSFKLKFRHQNNDRIIGLEHQPTYCKLLNLDEQK